MQVYTQSFGMVNVDTNNLYNGYTVDHIKERMQGWSDFDKSLYLKNVLECIDIQISGVNLNYIECIKRSNFNIAKRYI